MRFFPFLLLISLILTTCNIPLEPIDSPTPLIVPEAATLAPAQAVPLPTQTPLPNDSDWELLADGLEQRVLRVTGDDGAEMERVLVLRIDPTLYRFDVAYSPGAPKSLLEWSEETGALITINGGFYTAEYEATGLTIVNSVASGWNYDHGGMLAIWSGVPQVRSNVTEPYDHVRDSAEFGLQAFPLLINPNGTGYSDNSLDRARRTVVAQDNLGHTLLILTTRSYFTLTEMSNFLLKSDLNLTIALNLDGGTSTGLILTEPDISVPAFVLLPTVITVNRR